MPLDIMKNLDKVLACPICFEPYNKKERRPLSFECKHVFCEYCSKNLIKENLFPKLKTKEDFVVWLKIAKKINILKFLNFYATLYVLNQKTI
mgnify:CR=1 FL=1